MVTRSTSVDFVDDRDGDAGYDLPLRIDDRAAHTAGDHLRQHQRRREHHRAQHGDATQFPHEPPSRSEMHVPRVRRPACRSEREEHLDSGQAGQPASGMTTICFADSTEPRSTGQRR